MLNKKMRNSLRRLCEKDGGEILFDHQLRSHSTIAIGGKAVGWYAPSSLEELRDVRSFLDDSGVRWAVLGKGSNVLIPDEGLDAVVINLSGDVFKGIKVEGRKVTAGAGVYLGGLISECCRQGLGGLEGLVGIPGTVGGAVVMNASYRTSIGERLERVLVLDAGGRVKWVDGEDLDLGYRFSSFDRRDIILEAVFDLEEGSPEELKNKQRRYFLEKMRKQPLDEKTLGCVFKNPGGSEYAAGELIERSGMKGARRGGAVVSEKHANFIVNDGGASSADVIGLMEEMREKVRGKFGVELEPEVRILGQGSS